MKYITTIIVLLTSIVHTQLLERQILPSETDSLINGNNAVHYIYLDTTVTLRNKLLLFFPGTNAIPWDYRLFQQTAAKNGYHSIGLSYENLESINVEVCPGTRDTSCHGRARHEVWFGDDMHDSLEVSYSNSVLNRFTKLLVYLAENYPHEGWNNYLKNDSVIQWQHVVTAGHSQGAGHAAYGSKFFALHRVIMFSWVDWMYPGRNPIWITTPGPTADSAYLGFIHTGDASIYTGIPTTWNNLGMTAFGPITSVDAIMPPYNTHSLITSAPIDTTATQTNFHNATVVDWVTTINPSNGEPLYKPVWEYLLTADFSPLPSNKAMLISDPSMSCIDPEIYSDENYLAFQTGFGVVWLSGLNESDGTFTTQYGYETQIAFGAAPLITSFNGPEFGFDKNGWSMYFTKLNGGAYQPWKAVVNGSSVTVTPLNSSSVNRLSTLATKDDSATTVRLLYSLGPTLSTGELAWIDVASPLQEEIVDSLDEGVRWINGTQSFIYTIQTGANKGQLAIYNTVDKTKKIITDDADKKTYSYGWFAPEYNSLVTLCILNDSMLALYRDTGGSYWQRVTIIEPPASAYPYRYIGSPEPFVAGGKSYISCVLKKTIMSTGYVEAEVWVLGIEPNQTDRYYERCDDGMPSVKRTDPEFYTTDSKVYIYYNTLNASNIFEIWRYESSIPVHPQAVAPEQAASTSALVFYPNPVSSTITLPTYQGDSEIAVYNLLGEKLLTAFNTSKITLSSFPVGVYFLTMKTKDFFKTAKFLKVN